jgi:hypothetical protein
VNRRALLATTPIWLLLACSTSSTPPATQETNALTVGQKIDQALVKVMTDISAPAIGLLTPTAASPFIADLDLAGAGIAAFLKGTLPPPGAATFSQINSAFMIALNAAAPILAIVAPEAEPIILAVEAIDALLPVFETLLPATPAVAAMRASGGRARIHAAALKAGPMAPDEALARLNTYLGAK